MRSSALLLASLARVHAWKCPTISCTGWENSYNSILNGQWTADVTTDTAAPWTYTRTDNTLLRMVSTLAQTQTAEASTGPTSRKQ